MEWFACDNKHVGTLYYSDSWHMEISVGYTLQAHLLRKHSTIASIAYAHILQYLNHIVQRN